MQLTRLVEAGDLVRLSHGVYRDGGVPSGELDDLRAVWLSTEPGRLAYERLADGPAGVVVSTTAAANLHKIGDFRSPVFTFTTPTRRQSQKQEIRYRMRVLPDHDVAVVEGLPVTSRERTIADLLETREDLATVADAYRDACLQTTIDRGRLEDLLAPLAARYGYDKGDGVALLHKLDQLAVLDVDSVAGQVVASPELMAKVLEQVAASLPRPDMTGIVEALSTLPTIKLPPTSDLTAFLDTDAMRRSLQAVSAVQVPELAQLAATMQALMSSLPRVGDLRAQTGEVSTTASAAAMKALTSVDAEERS